MRLSGQTVTFYPDTLIFQLASSVDIFDLIKLISLNAASVKPVKKIKGHARSLTWSAPLAGDQGMKG